MNNFGVDMGQPIHLFIRHGDRWVLVTTKVVGMTLFEDYDEMVAATPTGQLVIRQPASE